MSEHLRPLQYAKKKVLYISVNISISVFDTVLVIASAMEMQAFISAA